jgi:hypothetical protein
VVIGGPWFSDKLDLEVSKALSQRKSQALWFAAIIPATQNAEVEGTQCNAGPRPYLKNKNFITESSDSQIND